MGRSPALCFCGSVGRCTTAQCGRGGAAGKKPQEFTAGRRHGDIPPSITGPRWAKGTRTVEAAPHRNLALSRASAPSSISGYPGGPLKSTEFLRGGSGGAEPQVRFAPSGDPSRIRPIHLKPLRGKKTLIHTEASDHPHPGGSIAPTIQRRTDQEEGAVSLTNPRGTLSTSRPSCGGAA